MPTSPNSARLASVTKDVARAAHQIHLRHRLSTVRHRRNGLRPADTEHAVHACKVGRDQHGGVGQAARAGRRADYHLVDAGHTCRYGRHQHRRRQTAGNVRSDAADGDQHLAVALGEIDPSLRPASLVELCAPLRGHFEGSHELVGHAAVGLGYGRLGHLERLRHDAVQAPGQLAQRVVPPARTRRSISFTASEGDDIPPSAAAVTSITSLGTLSRSSPRPSTALSSPERNQ